MVFRFYLVIELPPTMTAEELARLEEELRRKGYAFRFESVPEKTFDIDLEEEAR